MVSNCLLNNEQIIKSSAERVRELKNHVCSLMNAKENTGKEKLNTSLT